MSSFETDFEMNNINWKPLIWSEAKIITKFGPKKWVGMYLAKVYENCPKTKEKCCFMKLTSKKVISTGIPLFGPKIG